MEIVFKNKYEHQNVMYLFYRLVNSASDTVLLMVDLAE